jgi:hypothetical protein
LLKEIPVDDKEKRVTSGSLVERNGFHFITNVLNGTVG